MWNQRHFSAYQKAFLGAIFMVSLAVRCPMGTLHEQEDKSGDLHAPGQPRPMGPLEQDPDKILSAVPEAQIKAVADAYDAIAAARPYHLPRTRTGHADPDERKRAPVRCRGPEQICQDHRIQPAPCTGPGTLSCLQGDCCASFSSSSVAKPSAGRPSLRWKSRSALRVAGPN